MLSAYGYARMVCLVSCGVWSSPRLEFCAESEDGCRSITRCSSYYICSVPGLHDVMKQRLRLLVSKSASRDLYSPTSAVSPLASPPGKWASLADTRDTVEGNEQLDQMYRSLLDSVTKGMRHLDNRGNFADTFLVLHDFHPGAFRTQLQHLLAFCVVCVSELRVRLSRRVWV